MAVELAPQNIRVSSIAPTFIDTPLIRRIVDTQDKRLSAVPHPDGSDGSSHDVAATALFLASPASRHDDGHCLLVDMADRQ